MMDNTATTTLRIVLGGGNGEANDDSTIGNRGHEVSIRPKPRGGIAGPLRGLELTA
jgi:hypothetical protein